MKIHALSAGSDAPKLISKASYKLLDNDVKTAWINPRLISKVGNESFDLMKPVLKKKWRTIVLQIKSREGESRKRPLK